MGDIGRYIQHCASSPRRRTPLRSRESLAQADNRTALAQGMYPPNDRVEGRGREVSSRVLPPQVRPSPRAGKTTRSMSRQRNHTPCLE
jgi:hypothetical protein